MRIFRIDTLLLALFIFILINCDSEDEIKRKQIIVNFHGNGSGKIQFIKTITNSENVASRHSTEGGGFIIVDLDDVIGLKAIPDEGSSFSKWGERECSEEHRKILGNGVTYCYLVLGNKVETPIVNVYFEAITVITDSIPSMCTSYTILTNAFKRDRTYISRVGEAFNCDLGLELGNYRFMPNYYRLTTSPLGVLQGGTLTPIYMEASDLPTETNVVKDIQAIHAKTPGADAESFEIKIAHCEVDGETYYTYNLSGPSDCPIAYATETYQPVGVDPVKKQIRVNFHGEGSGVVQFIKEPTNFDSTITTVNRHSTEGSGIVEIDPDYVVALEAVPDAGFTSRWGEEGCDEAFRESVIKSIDKEVISCFLIWDDITEVPTVNVYFENTLTNDIPTICTDYDTIANAFKRDRTYVPIPNTGILCDNRINKDRENYRFMPNYYRLTTSASRSMHGGTYSPIYMEASDLPTETNVVKDIPALTLIEIGNLLPKYDIKIAHCEVGGETYYTYNLPKTGGCDLAYATETYQPVGVDPIKKQVKVNFHGEGSGMVQFIKEPTNFGMTVTTVNRHSSEGSGIIEIDPDYVVALEAVPDAGFTSRWEEGCGDEVYRNYMLSLPFIEVDIETISCYLVWDDITEVPTVNVYFENTLTNDIPTICTDYGIIAHVKRDRTYHTQDQPGSLICDFRVNKDRKNYRFMPNYYRLTTSPTRAAHGGTLIPIYMEASDLPTETNVVKDIQAIYSKTPGQADYENIDIKIAHCEVDGETYYTYNLPVTLGCPTAYTTETYQPVGVDPIKKQVKVNFHGEGSGMVQFIKEPTNFGMTVTTVNRHSSEGSGIIEIDPDYVVALEAVPDAGFTSRWGEEGCDEVYRESVIKSINKEAISCFLIWDDITEVPTVNVYFE